MKKALTLHYKLIILKITKIQYADDHCGRALDDKPPKEQVPKNPWNKSLR